MSAVTEADERFAVAGAVVVQPTKPLQIRTKDEMDSFARNHLFVESHKKNYAARSMLGQTKDDEVPSMTTNPRIDLLGRY